MTQQEWDIASEEERNAEIKKCFDEPWYLYNTYMRTSGMPEVTKEQWVNMAGFYISPSQRRIRRFNPIREIPVADYQKFFKPRTRQ